MESIECCGFSLEKRAQNQQKIAYSSSEQLFRALTVIEGTVNSLELLLSSKEIINTGEHQFDLKFENIADIRSDVCSRSDGTLTYLGKPVEFVFEEFYLEGRIIAANFTYELVAEQYFAQIKRNTKFEGPQLLDPDKVKNTLHVVNYAKDFAGGISCICDAPASLAIPHLGWHLKSIDEHHDFSSINDKFPLNLLY